MPADYNKDKVFGQIYDLYSPERLPGYIRSLGVVHGIDDITQDAFVRLYDRMGNVTNPIEDEKLVAYLYTIAKNLAHDEHRKIKRANQFETGVDDALLQSIPDTAPLPDEVYAEKELREEHFAAIEKLPRKMREAVRGLLEGKTFEVVALEIGIQIPALKYRLRQAKFFFKDGWQ